MKTFPIIAGALLVFSGIITGCEKSEDNDYPAPPSLPPVIVLGGGDSATVANRLDEFRSLLGEQLNATPGQTGGRREVNWDGVAASFVNNNSFPLDFFNNTAPDGPNGRKRGLVYADNGNQLRVDSSDFAEIDASYAQTFEPFSRKKLIAPAATHISEIEFRVAGTDTPASVSGFGAIFSDVDLENVSSIEFFDGTKSIGVYKVPATGGQQQYSFLGVKFSGEKITRVKIVSGNAALGAGVKDLSAGGTKDVVVIDDFIYSEPVAR